MHGQQNVKKQDIYQVLFNADGVSILGGSVHTIKCNTEDFLVGNKETGLEVNADKN